MRPETLERMAHEFSTNGHHRHVSVMHQGNRIDAVIVESWLAKKGDPKFTPGTWLVVIKINDPSVWQAIENGLLKGVSFEGFGERKPSTLHGKDAVEITDATIVDLSLVDKPATKRNFAMTKSKDVFLEQAQQYYDDAVANDKKSNVAIQSIDEALAQLAKEQAPEREQRQAIYKAQVEADAVANSGEVQRLRNRHSALMSKLFSLLESGGHDLAKREARLQDEIERVEIELAAAGYTQAPGIDDNSAFFGRGGSSTYLRSEPMLIGDAFGIATAEPISKAEGDEPLSHNTMGVHTTKADEDTIDLTSLMV